EHLGRGLHVERALLAVTEVLVGELEALVGHARPLLEASPLLLGADLEPELHDDDPAAAELLVHDADLVVRARPLGLCGEALDTLAEHAPVPRTIEDHGVSPPRKVPVEP